MFDSNILKLARETHIKDFCDANGIVLKQEDKHQNYRYEGFGGLIVKENYFVHFSDSQKGGNTVDFVMLIKNCDFKNAIEMITGIAPTNNQTITKNIKATKQFILPTRSPDNKRAIAYLSQKRKIDYEIIKEFINKDLLYQDNNNNVTFVWKDFDNKIVGANQRGTIDKKDFKRNVPGSNFDIGFTYLIGKPLQLLIFESAIDLLSVLTLKKIKKQRFNNSLLIATCNLNDRPIINALNHFDTIEKIFICYDNDQYAKEFIESLKLKKPFIYYHPTKFKDWNEYLQNMLG